MVKELFREYGSYKSELGWAPAFEGVRYRAAELGELKFDSQRRSTTARFFVGGFKLTETDIKLL